MTPRITLRQLSVFDAVARHNSVSRAAEEIALSQSAASMALADLEQHLKAPLFSRQGKRLLLNDFGRSLQPRVHALLRDARDIERAASQEQLQGECRIAASSTIGNYLIPGLIADFVSQHPQVHIDLEVGNTVQVEEAMLNLSADLGLIEGLCHRPQLLAERWRTDTLRVFCAPDHPFAQQDLVRLIELNDANWILREPGSGTREIFTMATWGKLDQLVVRLELGNSEAIKQAVRTGLGLSCLSESVIAEELAQGQLVALNVPELDLKRQLSVLKRREQQDSRLMAALVRHLSQHPTPHRQ